MPRRVTRKVTVTTRAMVRSTVTRRVTTRSLSPAAYDLPCPYCDGSFTATALSFAHAETVNCSGGHPLALHPDGSVT